MPPILHSPGVIRPRQFGPMMRAPRRLGELDHLRDLLARDVLGDDHDQLDAVLDRLEDGVAREARRHRDHRAVDGAVLGDHVAHAVVDRHAVDVAAGAAGRHAADDLRAVVEALARQVHGLAAGDALDDEGGVLVDEDGHRFALLHLRDGAAGGFVHRDAAIAVVDAVLREDLEAFVLPGAGDAEDRDHVGRLLARLRCSP